MLFMSTGRTTLTFVGRLKKLIGRPTAHEDGFNATTRSSTLSYAMRSTIQHAMTQPQDAYTDLTDGH